jgi:hypothetical protein
VTEAISKAEGEGRDAFDRGLDRTTNPYSYSRNQWECIAWARGYAAARTDLARKRRTAKNGDTK